MKKSIRAQILFGYLLIILVPVIITIVTVSSLFLINREVSSLSQNTVNRNATKDAVVGHYSWIVGLGDTILEGVPFTGSLDPATCGLGKWMATVSAKDLTDPTISAAMEKLKKPHDEIHHTASAVVALSKTDMNAAYRQYNEDIKPKVEEIIADITIITNKYAEFALATQQNVTNQLSVMLVVSVALVLVGIAAAYTIGTRTARRISLPIELVAQCSQKLAMGSDELDMSTVDISSLPPENEAAIMLSSFEAMAMSIKGNVEVVKKVAEGDLTAFVEVRSSTDSLGQNLYHMVQSNDLMFAQILQIAGEVASSANQISQASHSLAERNIEQVSFTDSLAKVVAEVNKLTEHNERMVSETLEIFGRVQQDVNESSGKMNLLVTAVEDIRTASDKISAVIKTIDDIAFQTNILALNAAVEAARAGAAGKGFAVVADEVRNLATKSSQAAAVTKELIESTIGKTHYGSKMAMETSQTFGNIHENISKTIGVVGNISAASKEQVAQISSVDQSIERLLEIATTNAASCEESSAASTEMRKSAGQLHSAMSKFNLRQREYGKPYIPHEKANDPTFIRQATENYERAVEMGRVNEARLDELVN